MVGAAPHATEPKRKVAMPARMTGLRPQRSASLPHTGIVTVIASMYIAPTQP